MGTAERTTRSHPRGDQRTRRQSRQEDRNPITQATKIPTTNTTYKTKNAVIARSLIWGVSVTLGNGKPQAETTTTTTPRTSGRHRSPSSI